MILFFLLLTLICIIAYPIIGYQIIVALKNREKKELRRLLIMLTFFILVPGFFWRVLPGSNIVWWPVDRVYETSFNNQLTGFKFNDGDIIYEYQSERSFNGDGYSIEIYGLDDETANYFLKPEKVFFKKYPSSKLRVDWQTKHWNCTPIDTSEQKFLDFAYSPLKELDFELEDLLSEQGNYYSYKYYLHEFSDSTIHIGNIDFYIICPKRRLIVEINSNT